MIVLGVVVVVVVIILVVCVHGRIRQQYAVAAAARSHRYSEAYHEIGLELSAHAPEFPGNLHPSGPRICSEFMSPWHPNSQ